MTSPIAPAADPSNEALPGAGSAGGDVAGEAAAVRAALSGSVYADYLRGDLLDLYDEQVAATAQMRAAWRQVHAARNEKVLAERQVRILADGAAESCPEFTLPLFAHLNSRVAEQRLTRLLADLHPGFDYPTTDVTENGRIVAGIEVDTDAVAALDGDPSAVAAFLAAVREFAARVNAAGDGNGSDAVGVRVDACAWDARAEEFHRATFTLAADGTATVEVGDGPAWTWTGAAEEMIGVFVAHAAPADTQG